MATDHVECIVDGCDEPIHDNAYPGEPRFWSRVQIGCPTECWPWLGAIQEGSGAGYGRVRIDGRRYLAHRFAYEDAVGPIPSGLVIDHVRARGCVRRDCVNPAHLEPVTQQENLLRADTFQATNAAKTHCPKGHSYSPGNTRVDRLGKRNCKECARIAHREWWHGRRKRGAE